MNAIVVLIAILAPAQPRPPVSRLVFSPDGRELMGVTEKKIHWYSLDLSRHPDFVCGFKQHGEVRFSPDGTKFAIAGGSPGEEGGISIWTLRPHPHPHTMITCGKDAIVNLSWRQDGEVLAISHSDNSVRLYRFETRTAPALKDVAGTIVCFVPYTKDSNGEKRLLLVGGDGRKVYVLDSDTAKPVHTFDNHDAKVIALTVRPGKESEPPLVASGGEDKTVRFWESTSGKQLHVARIESAPVTLDWLTDGMKIVAGCADGMIRVIDVRTEKTILEVKSCDGWTGALAITPKGTEAYVGNRKGEVLRIPLIIP